MTVDDGGGQAAGSGAVVGAHGQPAASGGSPPGPSVSAGGSPPGPSASVGGSPPGPPAAEGGSSPGLPTGQPRDPARGLRGIGAALLSMHALVVALAVPVIIHGDSRASGAAVAWLAAIAILDIVVAALLRRAERACVVAGSVLQAATIAAGVLSAFLLIVGVIFTGLWIGWLGMRRSLAAELAAARASAPPSGG